MYTHAYICICICIIQNDANTQSHNIMILVMRMKKKCPNSNQHQQQHIILVQRALCARRYALVLARLSLARPACALSNAAKGWKAEGPHSAHT